jgi:hypothetical protein
MSEEKTVVIRMSEGIADCCVECMKWTEDTQATGPVMGYEGTNDLLCWPCGHERAPELAEMVGDFFQSKGLGFRDYVLIDPNDPALGFRNKRGGYAAIDPNNPAMNFPDEASPARAT